jgi:acyl-CoA thioester hydrolase
VNNAVYLNYLEKARNDFLTSKGLSFDDFDKWQKFPVVQQAILEFKQPAKSGDELLINGWVSDHSPIRFTLTYNIFNRKSEKLILYAETKHVFVNQNNRPVRMPDEFYQKFIKQSRSVGKKES